mmetsp:Transcript_83182/g.243906  ORF Transcript_83182/g.243906 Transcript_83182/m.243906 type:complete len:230 (-) Transcript_83182:450-1139(-)
MCVPTAIARHPLFVSKVSLDNHADPGPPKEGDVVMVPGSTCRLGVAVIGKAFSVLFADRVFSVLFADCVARVAVGHLLCIACGYRGVKGQLQGLVRVSAGLDLALQLITRIHGSLDLVFGGEQTIASDWVRIAEHCSGVGAHHEQPRDDPCRIVSPERAVVSVAGLLHPDVILQESRVNPAMLPCNVQALPAMPNAQNAPWLGSIRTRPCAHKRCVRLFRTQAGHDAGH